MKQKLFENTGGNQFKLVKEDNSINKEIGTFIRQVKQKDSDADNALKTANATLLNGVKKYGRDTTKLGPIITQVAQYLATKIAALVNSSDVNRYVGTLSVMIKQSIASGADFEHQPLFGVSVAESVEKK